MTEEQIITYEYCKKDIAQLKGWKEKLPFGHQNHGCGSQVPNIEHELEQIHRTMYEVVRSAMNAAIEEIEKKINSI
jgi:hypothetical protein